MSGRETLVIVGNGMATGRLLDDLEAIGCERYQICVIGDEPVGGYNRIMLSPVLAGEIDAEAIMSKPAEWFDQRGILFKSGVRVESINRAEHYVLTDQGEKVSYDALVLATGSRPARIPAGNQAIEGVTAFRTLADVARIQLLVEKVKGDISEPEAIVIGGGFLGLEAAYGLAQQGAKVTLVHRSGWLLNRQLDEHSASYLKTVLENKNITFRLNAEVETFIGEHYVEGAQLKSGERLTCQLVVIATGITPNKELAVEAELTANRGVVVDEFMRASDPAIYALGECVEFNGETFGLVEPIWQQSKVLAEQLNSGNGKSFANQAVATKLKVSGVQLFSAGEHLTKRGLREIVFDDPTSKVYRKLLLAGDKLVGIVLFGDTRGGQEYLDAMLGNVGITGGIETMVFGSGFFDTANTAA